jgi:hypothetical protein
MKIRATFLNPVFEHLQTIATHAQGAQDAVKFFLDTCALHKLWPYVKSIQKFINSPDMPLKVAPSFFNLFSFFNFDQTIVAMHNNVDTIKAGFTDIRAKISNRLFSLVSSLINDKSSEWKYRFSFDIGTIPPPEHPYRDDLMDNQAVLNSLKSTKSISDVNHFLKSLPKSIGLFGERFENVQYVLDRLNRDLTRILLLGLHKNISSFTDSSQVLWSFFTESYQNFLSALFNCTIDSTILAGDNLSKQMDAFLGKGPLAPPDVNDNSRLIFTISTKINQFIMLIHESTRYVPFIQRFSGGENYSIPYFMEIFRALGIHAALYLDCQIIHFCNTMIKQIVTVFNTNSSFANLSTNNATSFNSYDSIVDSADALLRLSVGLAVRQLIRSAITAVIRETAPGFVEIIGGATPKEANNASKVLDELFDTKDGLFFFEQSSKGLLKGNVKDFFSYLALLLGSPKWNELHFFPDENALSKNLHLLPLAVGLFVRLVPTLKSGAGQADADEGVKIFFQTILSKVMEDKKKLAEGQQSINEFMILMDMFPKLADNIEYGQISPYFPYSIVTWCYPTSEAPKPSKTKKRDRQSLRA